MKNVFDYIELTDDYSIYEIPRYLRPGGQEHSAKIVKRNIISAYWLAEAAGKNQPAASAGAYLPRGGDADDYGT